MLRGVIERLTDIVTRQEVIGGRTMKTIMSPMKDDTGRRLGTVLEWFDRTQEVATESELQEVIAAVTAGNLDNRISLEGKRDFFLTLSQRHQRAGGRDRRRWSSKCAAWWPRPTRAT